MLDKKTCALWATMDQYKRRLGKTRAAIAEMLRIVRRPYITFSCGKDSSALADMILRQNPKIPLRFLSSGETRIIHNVDDVMTYFRETYDADIEEIRIDRVFSPEWRNASFDEQRHAGRRDLQRLDNSAYDGVFMGLRAEESRHRQISLIMHQGRDLPRGLYKYADRDFYRACPLRDWKTEDVGAYITTHRIPVLKWYEHSGFEARTTARLTGDAVRQNTLFWLKLNNPAGYARLMQRFPELRAY